MENVEKFLRRAFQFPAHLEPPNPHMRKLLTILTLSIATLGAVSHVLLAEDTSTPECRGHSSHHDPTARLNWMTEKLGLSPAQQDAIKLVLEEDAPKFKAILAKGRENLVAEDKAALKDLMEKQGEAIKSVLTPEQRAKMKEGWAHHSAGEKLDD